MVRTTVTLGMLVALLVWQRPTWRMPVVVAAAGFLALVGAARLASGEHWPLDVLGGYALGTLWLAVLLIARRFRTVPPRGRRGG